jgi:hypothetical protein
MEYPLMVRTLCSVSCVIMTLAVYGQARSVLVGARSSPSTDMTGIMRT